MRRTAIYALLLIFVLSCCLEVRAEVSVRLDRSGNYVKTQIVPVGPQSENRAWGLRGRSFRNTHALNIRGDTNGDLWPAIAETPKAPHYPLVVWSRFNGSNYDIAWSRWSGTDWSSIRSVSQWPMPGNDLDPDLVFDRDGRAYLVWWSDMNGSGGQVFFSVFLYRRWHQPILISDPAVDSRLPTLDLSNPKMVAINYETPEGRATHYITFASPNTITDDINPQNTTTLIKPVEMIGLNGLIN